MGKVVAAVLLVVVGFCVGVLWRSANRPVQPVWELASAMPPDAIRGTGDCAAPNAEELERYRFAVQALELYGAEPNTIWHDRNEAQADVLRASSDH